MIRKLFANNNLFLLSTPENTFDKKVISARFDRYLSQNKENSPLLVFAAVLLSIFHIQLNTPLLHLALWQGCVVLFVAALYYIDHRYQHDSSFDSIRNLVIRRTVVSFMLGALFGSSIFLFSTDTPIDYLHLYFIILICIFGVILIVNVVYPEYYITYAFIMLTFPLLHAMLRVDSHSDSFVMVATILYLVGPVVMLQKATKMSRVAINEISYSLILKDQMAELLELQQAIHHQSLHDELTGLANRRNFEATAEELEDNAEKYGSKFAVIYIDLDKFKSINDTYGHKYGDLVLQEMAKRISGSIRELDQACRIGGDEFCVLLKHVSDRMELDSLSARLKEKLCQPFAIGDIKLPLSASIGSAMYPEDGGSFDQLVTNADHMMYQQKKNAS